MPLAKINRCMVLFALLSAWYPLMQVVQGQGTVPKVFTTTISDITTTSAVVYGLVTPGDLEILGRGVCWNTTGNPDITDSNIVVEPGTGLFTTEISGLEPNTPYFVRTYATNAAGTGYGAEKTFTTLEQKPPLNLIVAQDGSGDFTTVQAAFDAVPEHYTAPVTILVKNGVYKEKLLLRTHQVNVILVGEDRDNTILTYDDYSGRVNDNGIELGTSTSYSVAIDASDFTAKDITFQNTSQAAQAVALRVNGDRVTFYNCNMLGFQDTYYTWGYGRIYNSYCYIEGTVDFIFGRSITVFDHCIINSKRNAPVTAASTEQNYKFGYVFRNCVFVADPGINRATLGRPWRPYARTVILESELGAHIDPAGWLEWSGNDNHLTAYYAEYQCSGPGYVPQARVPWSYQLTDEEAAAYTLDNIFAKASASPIYGFDWLPLVYPEPNGFDPNDIDPNEPVDPNDDRGSAQPR